MLCEFKEHEAAVTDVAFHPNELLLSSSSTDGTVKFWDLEKFQQVSSTPPDAGPVHRIVYHPDGRALFSAPKDIVKVQQWEPSRTQDTLIVGWGKVKDLMISPLNQIIGGSASHTNVSVFIVDLKHVKPFSSSLTPSKSMGSLLSRDSSTRYDAYRIWMRAVFVRPLRAFILRSLLFWNMNLRCVKTLSSVSCWLQTKTRVSDLLLGLKV